MATNFDYLLEKELFGEFAEQAVEAEKAIAISPATCAILSRRALELAVRFVYSYDYDLKLPYRDNVSSLIHEQTFRDIIEPGLFGKLKYVIKLGNIAVHTNNSIKREMHCCHSGIFFVFATGLIIVILKNITIGHLKKILFRQAKRSR